MGKLIVVAGAQYGSEGKGAVADQLLRPSRVGGNVVAIRVAGPNAGHTVYGQCPDACEAGLDHLQNGVWIGHPWRLRSVPVAAVSNRQADLVIAAGSEIDNTVLRDEVRALDAAGYAVSGRLIVDSQATMLTPAHIADEVADHIQDRLGSTAKGIGAARSDRIWRHAKTWGQTQSGAKQHSDTAAYTRERLRNGATVLIEGTQGFGLGLHAGEYPFCTSSDCRAIDFLAMAGLSPWGPEVDDFEVWLAARVRPIRVAGNSGPLANETSWAELGLPEEHTTVTKKVRRVGDWDAALVRRAIAANGGSDVVRVALTMVDTKIPSLAGLDGNWWLPSLWADQPGPMNSATKYLREIADELGINIIDFVGTGPVTGLFTSMNGGAAA